MRIEVLIRLEGDYEEESQRTPDLIFIHRLQSLVFPIEAQTDPAVFVASASDAVETAIDGSTGEFRQQMAVIADILKAAAGP